MTTPDDKQAAPEKAPDLGALFRAAMQRVPSPVSVIAWVDADGCGGMTCTAVSSAGAMPPRLSVCIRADGDAARRIRGAGAFSVNFLTEDQSEVARSFSASGRGEAGPFDHGVWRPGPTGAPLLDDAVAAFECRLEREMESGAHVILLGRVERQAAGTGGGLLYRDGFLRRVATE